MWRVCVLSFLGLPWLITGVGRDAFYKVVNDTHTQRGLKIKVLICAVLNVRSRGILKSVQKTKWLSRYLIDYLQLNWGIAMY